MQFHYNFGENDTDYSTANSVVWIIQLKAIIKNQEVSGKIIYQSKARSNDVVLLY